jgi:hypothetical protein
MSTVIATCLIANQQIFAAVDARAQAPAAPAAIAFRQNVLQFHLWIRLVA